MNSKLLPNQERLDLMLKGTEQLHTWLLDIAHVGILEQDLSADSLSEVAGRMVDAKMGSIARRIRQLAYIDKSDVNWVSHLQTQFSLLYLFVKNFKRLSSHTLPMQLSILTWAGYSIKKSALNPDKGIKDVWSLMAIEYRQEEQLRVRKCWVVGANSKRFALILDFAFGRARFEQMYEYGKSYKARLNYFPSNFPLRGVLFSIEPVKLLEARIPAFDSIEKFLDQYARALAKNPWLTDFPCSLSQVRVMYHGEDFYLVDEQKHMLKLRGEESFLWSLLATSGGYPMTIFGEWNGTAVNPSSYVEKGRVVSLIRDA